MKSPALTTTQAASYQAAGWANRGLAKAAASALRAHGLEEHYIDLTLRDGPRAWVHAIAAAEAKSGKAVAPDDRHATALAEIRGEYVIAPATKASAGATPIRSKAFHAIANAHTKIGNTYVTAEEIAALQGKFGLSHRELAQMMESEMRTARRAQPRMRTEIGGMGMEDGLSDEPIGYARDEHRPASSPGAYVGEPVSFYSTKDPRTGGFSNFARTPFEFFGKTWPTSEHFFQAMKFATTDPQHAENIRLAATPAEAAEMGRDRSKPLRSDWEQVKDDVMRLAVVAKFEQNQNHAQALLATDNTHLIEDAPHDGYWGTGSAKGGGGKNMLGLILEETREVLRIDGPRRASLKRQLQGAGSHMEEDGLAHVVLPSDAYKNALIDGLGLSALARSTR